MGGISLEQLLPERFGNPDAAGPISSLHMPLEGAVMRAGFERGSRGALVFEGETTVTVRLGERVWRYKQEPDTSTIKTARRWRLEFGVKIDDAGPLLPGHVAVVAQEPYGNTWLQRAFFKKYSKKSEEERPLPEVPRLEEDRDPVEWLEQNADYDPWEKNARLVAGISQPHGFLSDNPRNSAGDLILGACPDFDGLVGELWTSGETQRLLDETKEGRIVFWNRAKVQNPPRLYPEVIEDCEALMGISIQQALAGPRRSPEKWIGQPVWRLLGLIYRDHLNERNRVVHRRLGHEVDGGGAVDLW